MKKEITTDQAMAGKLLNRIATMSAQHAEEMAVMEINHQIELQGRDNTIRDLQGIISGMEDRKEDE